MIPVCEPLLDGNERKYVDDCIDTSWISSGGKYIDQFEKAFAAYCGCKFGITTTNGTAALHLALAALGIGPGDEVIVPTFTMAASALAVVYTGARPVFVDCDPDTFNICSGLIAELTSPHTKAIMPVHLYGHPCDMGEVTYMAKLSGEGIHIVEDAAEAHGAMYFGSKAGGIGDFGCFSFYGNKIITTGEGGMVVTNDERLAERARRLKDLAHDPKRRFRHTDIAFNYRMTNVQAAMGLAQLESIERFVDLRRAHAYEYNNRLRGVKGVTLPVERPGCKNVYWMYTILVESEDRRDGLMNYLAVKSIQTRTVFIPMHEQPIFKQYVFPGQTFPVAEDVSRRGLYLPSGSGLTMEQLDSVCEHVAEFMEYRTQ
jgi:perosamine synthetase